MSRWPLALATALLALQPVSASAQQALVYRIPVTGTIELGLAPYIARGIEEAHAQRAAIIVLDIDTPGGRIDAAQQIVKAVTGSELPIYALVNTHAWSAGAIIALAADSLGAAESMIEQSVAYAQERQAFGKSISKHQAVAFRLADMATQLHAATTMVLEAAALRDAGRPCLQEACMAKLFASEAAERICSDAIQVFGGYGYSRELPVEKIYRDVRVAQIYEGTSDVQRIIISRQLLQGS